MALVTLAEAKEHLRIPADEHGFDADINTKLQAASDIVLDYLKSRVHRTAVITSSSVASPTVITTEEEHGYVSAETVTITDHVSTPDINGARVVTVLSTTTFSIPVAVTVAGTGGLATIEWTSTTVPRLVHAATLLVIEDLYERRPIDWDSIRRLLERSRDPALA